MGGHAYRRENKKEREAALTERAQRSKRKSTKAASAVAGTGKGKKTR